ncbi:MAG: chemotaxis signal transduction protein CheV [Betaproteobacteria bacterium]|nr:MAG: chemotaxis signal transduction protein CheV [Betaproteobacteria bacterium]
MNDTNTSESRSLLESVDERTRLAGSNRMEILLFFLGDAEVFGINVFKVREVTLTPRITRTPHMPRGVEGVISLRGAVIPVLDLGSFVGVHDDSDTRRSTLIVTEFCGRVQGFLVNDVERIARIDWDQVKPPSSALAGADAMVTAITRLSDGRLVSILDVEQVLARAFGQSRTCDVAPLDGPGELSILFADDSPTARREISGVLEKLGVRYQQAANGREAWDKLQALADQAHAEGVALSERLRLVLADAEMPEMDGYVLARHIKSDGRFAGIPVVMHTSLSSPATSAMGRTMGVDAFITKFDAANLAATLRPLLLGHAHVAPTPTA